MFEKDININEVKEIRTRTTVFFGVGAIKKIEDIAKDLLSAMTTCTSQVIWKNTMSYPKTGNFTV